MNQIKPYRKLKGVLLASFLLFGFIGISSANYLADWPDDALCQWMANPSPPEHIVKEVERRGIGCDGGKAVAASNNKSKNTPQANSETKTASKSNTSGKDSKIKIYDVEFTPGILDELLNLVISKTEYDFSAHRLSSNKDNFTCGFSLKRIIYENDPNGDVENWNMLTGDQSTIYDLGVNGFLVPNQEDALAPGGFLHSEKLILLDQFNRIRGYYDGTDSLNIPIIVQHIQSLI